MVNGCEADAAGGRDEGTRWHVGKGMSFRVAGLSIQSSIQPSTQSSTQSSILT